MTRLFHVSDVHFGREDREAIDWFGRKVKEEQPDAVVSDIGLPDVDGYAFIRQLRAREAARGGFLPAMALTGYSSADDQARAVAAGYQCHMAKPAEPIALTRALAKIVAATAAAPRH